MSRNVTSHSAAFVNLLLLTLAPVPCLLAAEERSSPVTALVFTPAGDHLLVGRDRSVEIRSVDNWQVQRTLSPGFPKVRSLAFSPDGRILAVAGGVPGVSGGVATFAWPSGTSIGSFTNHHDFANVALFDSSGTHLITAGSDGKVEKLSWPGGESAREFNGHAGPVMAAILSPDDQLLITAGTDRSVKVWDADTGRLARSFSHHQESVHCLALRPAPASPNPGEAAKPLECATGSADRTVRVWQPSIGRLVRIIRGHQAPIFSVAYSRDGATLLSAGQDGHVRVFDADSDELLYAWKAQDDWIYTLAFSPGGDLLATGDWSGALRLWKCTRQQSHLVHESIP